MSGNRDSEPGGHPTLPRRAVWIAGIQRWLSGLLIGLGLLITSPLAPIEPSIITGTASSSGGIAITPDGSTVFVVNPDAGSVSAVDTRTDEKVGEVSVGENPRALALDPQGRRLYVTSQGSAALAVLDAGRLSVLATIQVGAEPYGVVADPLGHFVYVASSATATVEVVDVGLRQVIARIPVDPKPKGLAVSADGTRLYVTHFLSGEVSVIDPIQRTLLQVISTGNDSNMAQKIALHPMNGWAYLPHIRSNVTNRNLLFDTTVFPVVSAIDLATNQHLPKERVDLSVGQRSVNLPFDLTFSPDGRYLYVVNLGSGDMSVIDLAVRKRVADVDVGDGPRGIVLTPDGRKAYVANSLSDDVSVIDLTTFQETKRIPVTISPLAPQIKRGKLLFFSSRLREISKDRWMSCASCHFEGDHDGRTWFTPRGPRNTTSLRGAGDTRPLHWSADRDEVQDFEFTIRELQAGTGLIRDGAPNPTLGAPNAGRSADLDALAAFVESLRPKPSPFRNPDGSLTSAAQRGRAIFERPDVGCVSCHSLPRFTDSTLAASPFITHDVGTGNGPDERLGPAFDTPSLRGLWDSAPYLHDGSAPTLRDVLTTRNPGDRHGRTSHLSEAEVQDLLAFLPSLDGGASRAFGNWTPLPGGRLTATGPEAVIFNGELWVFVQGVNNRVYQNRLTAVGWTGWSEVPGGGLTSSGPEAVEFNGELWVFVRGMDDRVYANRFNGQSWTGWNEVPGGGLTSSGPGAVVFNSELSLFVRGTNNKIYLNRFSGQSWSGWSEVPGGGLTLDAPAAVVFESTLSLFVRGIDNRLYDNLLTQAGWTGWAQVPGGFLTSSGPAAAVFNGELWAFVGGGDNRIYQNRRLTAGSWTGWSEVAGNGMTPSKPGAAATVSTLYLVVQGTDNGIYLNQLRVGTVTEVRLTDPLQFVLPDGSNNAVVSLELKVGDTVRWVHTGNLSHTVTSGSGSADPEVGRLFDRAMSQGSTFEYSFSTSGTFAYFCRLHEGQNMRGTIIVNPR